MTKRAVHGPSGPFTEPTGSFQRAGRFPSARYIPGEFLDAGQTLWEAALPGSVRRHNGCWREMSDRTRQLAVSVRRNAHARTWRDGPFQAANI
jgi:hypothetical protein